MLDSGALYRLVALKALRRRASRSTTKRALAAAARGLDVEFADGRILLDGDDVTEAIRSRGGERRGLAGGGRCPACARRCSPASRRSGGRRAWSPTAATWAPWCSRTRSLKVFVTASAEERARRRYKQLIEKGNSVNIDSLLRDIRERDARDAGRAAAPLKPAADAVILDTTELTIDDAVAFVLDALSGCGRRTRQPGAT